MVLQVYKRFQKWDVFIIAFALILSVVFFSFSFSSTGETVVVTVDGELYCSYPLFENRSIDVKTDFGNITVQINGNKAFVSKSDCKDNKCIKEKEISRKGQTIVCLPLRVIVEIGGSKYEYAY